MFDFMGLLWDYYRGLQISFDNSIECERLRVEFIKQFANGVFPNTLLRISNSLLSLFLELYSPMCIVGTLTSNLD